MNNQYTEQEAQQNAEQKLEFRIHMITYIEVNSILAIINLSFTPRYPWFIWPLLGWGLGISIHGINVRFSTNSNFREGMMKREMEKHLN